MIWLNKELEYLKISYELISVDEISVNLYYNGLKNQDNLAA